ncbi:KAP family NTPase [Pseudomonas luteola]
MESAKPAMKMAELLVFAKPLAIGIIGVEMFRVAFYLGENFAPSLQRYNTWQQLSGVLFVILICLLYAHQRGAHLTAMQMVKSLRLDLLLALGIGVWINLCASPLLSKFHNALQAADPQITPPIFFLLCLLVVAPLCQNYWPRRKDTSPQLYFIGDEEISDEANDFLETKTQARSFAETVLASGGHPGLIFGVDGPWGIGKTSFINLAEKIWSEAPQKPILCRFEPLRYASEPDIADRLIKDLSAAIQREVFAPEFRPAASRYSRLIKGKAEISFLGFKLAMEPSQETVDDLLDDIDEVLRRIGRRVIIVVDDLDRLDAKTTNSILFATRRTFRLSQATYVLCYDTEILVGTHEEGVKAREFLEKFVTVKLSLFVDSSGISKFLRHSFESDGLKLGTVPSDSIIKLSSVLTELADMLDGPLGSAYLPLIGNIRKVKRFVNSLLIIQLERSDLGKV